MEWVADSIRKRIFAKKLLILSLHFDRDMDGMGGNFYRNNNTPKKIADSAFGKLN